MSQNETYACIEIHDVTLSELEPTLTTVPSTKEWVSSKKKGYYTFFYWYLYGMNTFVKTLRLKIISREEDFQNALSSIYDQPV